VASTQSREPNALVSSEQEGPPLEGQGGLEEEHADVEEPSKVDPVDDHVGVEAKKDPKRTRERCRQAARRLAAGGEVLIMQEGKVMDSSFAKGVLELRLP
jgi:Protein of unknown function (DUF3253)